MVPYQYTSVGLGNDDLLAGMSLFQQAREVGFGFVDVHDHAHEAVP
jgi:hypothetical protein